MKGRASLSSATKKERERPLPFATKKKESAPLPSGSFLSDQDNCQKRETALFNMRQPLLQQIKKAAPSDSFFPFIS